MWRFLCRGRICCYYPFCTKTSFKISHSSNVHQSCCLEANSHSYTGIPNTGSNLGHSQEGPSEEATRANAQVQLCEEGPQEPRFLFSDLERRASVLPCQISEFRKYQKIPRTLPRADLPVETLTCLILYACLPLEWRLVSVVCVNAYTIQRLPNFTLKTYYGRQSSLVWVQISCSERWGRSVNRMDT